MKKMILRLLALESAIQEMLKWNILTKKGISPQQAVELIYLFILIIYSTLNLVVIPTIFKMKCAAKYK